MTSLCHQVRTRGGARTVRRLPELMIPSPSARVATGLATGSTSFQGPCRQTLAGAGSKSSVVAALPATLVASKLVGDGAIGGLDSGRVEAAPSAVGRGVDETDGSEEVVVHGVGRGHGVDGDHAGCVDCSISDVALLAPLFGGEGFILESGGADQLVAPEAALAGVEGADDAEDVDDVAPTVELDLGADLDAGDEVLVHDGVHDQTRLGGVGGEENVVAVQQLLGRSVVGDVIADCVDADGGVGLSGDTAGDHDFGSGEALAQCP